MPGGIPGVLPPALPPSLQPVDAQLPEAAAPHATRPAEEDLEERWLFRRQGMVYGPFSGRDIARKIEAKELDESCEVSEEDGPWRSLRDSAEFWPVVARAKAREQAEQARLAAERALRRETLLRRIKIGGGIVGGVAALAALAGIGVSMLGSSDGSTEPTAGHALSGEPSDLGTMDGTPGITESPLPPLPSELSKGAEAKKTASVAKKRRRPRKRKRRPKAAKAATKTAAVPPPANGAAPGKEGTRESHVADFSSGEPKGGGVPKAKINQIIQRNQKGLVRCIQAEVRRNPTFEGEFMVNFAILPSGSAGKVSLDNADDATPKMLFCMKAELARWHFPSFSGASFQVSLPFNIAR